MASKGKGAMIGAPVEAPYIPSTHIELRDENLEELEGLEIGKKYSVLLEGKVVGMHISEHEYDGKKRRSGHVELEAPTVCIHEKGKFDDLLDDDEED